MDRTFFRSLFSVLIKSALCVTVIGKQGQAQQPTSSLESFRKVCYFTNWSCDLLVREAHFCLRHVDVSLCTHIVYAFAGINVTSLSLSPTRVDDESRGDVKGRYVLFNELKKNNKQLKTLLSVGGSYQTEMFVQVASSATARSQFAYNSAHYVRKWGFDGLDLDWEYPLENHKEAMTSLIQDLRLSFLEEAELSGNPELLLSIAAPASDEKVMAGFEVNLISQQLDMINLMAYDFYGAWGRITGFNSPLYPRASDTRISHKHCVEWSVNLWLHLGAPAHKINLGIAAYGQSFTLDTKKGESTHLNVTSSAEKTNLPATSAENATLGSTFCKDKICPKIHAANGTRTDQREPLPVFGVGAKSIGPGKPGRLRHFNGQLSYPEICENSLLNNGRIFWDEEQQVPYVTYDDQWIGFDDVRSVAVKVKWAIKQQLGGIMFWSLDLDDFSGQYCGEGRYPLLTAAHSTVACLMDRAVENTTVGSSYDDCPGRRSRNGSESTLSLFELLLAQSLVISNGGLDDDWSRTGRNSSRSQIALTRGNDTRPAGSRTGSLLIDKLRHNPGLRGAGGVEAGGNSTRARLQHDNDRQGNLTGHRRAGPKRQPNDNNGPHHRRRTGHENGDPQKDPNVFPEKRGKFGETLSKEQNNKGETDSFDYEDLDSASDLLNNYYYYIAFKADTTVPPDVFTTTSAPTTTTTKMTTTKRTTAATTATTTKRPAVTTTRLSHKEKSGIPAHLRRNTSRRNALNFGSILTFILLSIFF